MDKQQLASYYDRAIKVITKAANTFDSKWMVGMVLDKTGDRYVEVTKGSNQGSLLEGMDGVYFLEDGRVAYDHKAYQRELAAYTNDRLRQAGLKETNV